MLPELDDTTGCTEASTGEVEVADGCLEMLITVVLKQGEVIYQQIVLKLYSTMVDNFTQLKKTTVPALVFLKISGQW